MEVILGLGLLKSGFDCHNINVHLPPLNSTHPSPSYTSTTHPYSQRYTMVQKKNTIITVKYNSSLDMRSCSSKTLLKYL